jgi:predicted 3-demethylubiquinone-9 3-methyltransferase (glyoxalase superfamily)
MLFGQDFGATDFAGAQICVPRTIIVHQPCNTQQDMDYFLEKPSAGPKAGQCGWLKYSHVRAMIYAGEEKRRSSVAGIGMVL